MAQPIRVSFEFFPPKTEEMEKTLWEAIERLAPLSPTFVSVTYGAGGSTRERTHATVRRIVTETALTPAAHLTCVGAATKPEIDAVIQSYRDVGVRHIVALRGDPHRGRGGKIRAASRRLQERRRPGRRHQAHRRPGSVSAYPEKHPDSPTVDADIDMLKAKVDAGATRAITQFFFDNDVMRLCRTVRARGIDIPIVPGIVPVQSFKQMVNFAEGCGAACPLACRALRRTRRRPRTRESRCRAVAAEQVLDLVDRGVTDFHFYTMNRADLVYRSVPVTCARRVPVLFGALPGARAGI